MPREGNNPMQPLNSEEGDTQGSSSGSGKSAESREAQNQPTGPVATSEEGGGGEVQVDPKAGDLTRKEEITPKGQ